MNSLIRISCAVNKVTPANPPCCCESIHAILNKLTETNPDIIVFPSYSLCAKSSGSLLKNPCIADMCSEALDTLIPVSADMCGVLVVGLIMELGDTPVAVTAIVNRGMVVGLIPHENSCCTVLNSQFPILEKHAVFEVGGLRYCVIASELTALTEDVMEAAKTGCDAVIVTSASPMVAGQMEQVKNELSYLSSSLGIAVALSNGGVGDTSSPYMHCGLAAIAENGKILAFKRSFQKEIAVNADVDCEIIRTIKKHKLVKPVFYQYPSAPDKKGLLRTVRKNPYLPENVDSQNEYLLDLFTLQTESLVARMTNTGLKKLILGVSGGLDSTLAILVAVNALKQLNLPMKNLIGVTMPGFGTSDRTYYNALSLIDLVGAVSMDISIKESVLQHFEDIGHNVAQKDVTYENAQARERSQILFDLGNKNSALVVGTGDLSEAALGWCTFGGDHLAGYNVNICITKTVIRQLVSFLAQNDVIEGTADILNDILDTPVSPELLPPDESGNITQKTESILGSYDLHDFFIYYLVKYNLRPEKIFFYACVAFSPELSPAYIKEKLILFLKRFFGSQFKRSCSPDSAAITEVNLNGVTFTMPSDASYRAFVSGIENLTLEP